MGAGCSSRRCSPCVLLQCDSATAPYVTDATGTDEQFAGAEEIPPESGKLNEHAEILGHLVAWQHPVPDGAAEPRSPCGSSETAGPRPPSYFATGEVYTGQWLGEVRHGFGTQRWPDGSHYEGQWARDVAEGRGRMRFSNGDVYTGEFLAGKLDGLGAYRVAAGGFYLGTFSKDVRQGPGFETSGTPGVKYLGFFHAGGKHGPGMGAWPNGGRYWGEWRDDAINGWGSHCNAKGGIFRGKLLNAEKEGLGCHVWPDGRAYVGTYVAGRESGFGCYVDVGGQSCEVGYWQGSEFLRPAPRSDAAPSPDELARALAKLVNLAKLAAQQPQPELEGVLEDFGKEDGDAKPCGRHVSFRDNVSVVSLS